MMWWTVPESKSVKWEVKCIVKILYLSAKVNTNMHARVVSRVQHFCNPTDCSSPGFSVHGISQGRIQEWLTISSSRGCPVPRDWNPHLLCLLCWQVHSLPLSLGSPYSNIDSTNFKFSLSEIHFVFVFDTRILQFFNSQKINPKPLASSSFPWPSEMSHLY